MAWVQSVGGTTSGVCDGKGFLQLPHEPLTQCEACVVEKLSLSGCSVDDEQLQELAQVHGQVKLISLRHTAITDASIDTLIEHCGSLVALGVNDTDVTHKGLARLWQRFPQLSVSWDPTPKVATLLPTSQYAGQPWQYTFETPGEDWASVEFDDSAWATGEGPFGDRKVDEIPGVPHRTEWKVEPRIWLRRGFEVADIPEGNLVLQLAFDDVQEVRLNDRTIYDRAVFREFVGFIRPDFSSGYEVQLVGTARDLLQPGKNVLTVHGDFTNGGGGRVADAGLLLIPIADTND